jgi:hypothetical protein
MPIHEAFRREGDFSFLDARFENVANLDMHLLADTLGNKDGVPVHQFNC